MPPKTNPNPNKYAYPLHEIGQMHDPIAARLAWAEEALSLGHHDPNELDLAATEWRVNRGRPLHAALEHAGDADERTGERRARCESLDLVALLLARGADPRLRCCRGAETPLDVARERARERSSPAASGEADEAARAERRFYEAALRMMEEAARKLDEEEKEKEGAGDKGIFGNVKRILGLKGDRRGSGDHRDVECLFCREGKRHNWHYWVYTGTEEEYRTLEATDNTVREQL